MWYSWPLTKKWGGGSAKKECVRLLGSETKRLKKSSPWWGYQRPGLSETSRAVGPACWLRWEGAQVQVWLLGPCLWVFLGPSVVETLLVSVWSTGAPGRIGRWPSVPGWVEVLWMGPRHVSRLIIQSASQVYLIVHLEESSENCPHREDG